MQGVMDVGMPYVVAAKWINQRVQCNHIQNKRWNCLAND